MCTLGEVPGPGLRAEVRTAEVPLRPGGGASVAAPAALAGS
jgi:hypothetical protein